MNRKIFALVLGGTMLVASAFAFAGCDTGHKHKYKISYQLADCDTEGYTLHTCTDCGYKYADNFIEPYGHAYRDYYHLEEEERVQTISYALTANGGSGSHYSLFTTVTPEQLEELKDAGKDLCVHKQCEFCDASIGGERDIAFEDMMQQMIDKMIGSPLRPRPIDRYWYNIPSVLHINEEYFSKKKMTQDDLQPMLVVGPRTTASVMRATASAAPSTPNFVWDLIIPDCITEIEDFDEDISKSAVYNALERVSLSENLETIGKNVFNSTSIKSIVIPEKLNSVAQNAFGNCNGLMVVFYKGTEEAWKLIDIAEGNKDLVNATTYFYSETKPTAVGNFWHYVDGEPTVW